MATVVAIPDLHAPYQHPDSLDFIRDLKQEWKPDHMVCLGDEADRHRLSTHPHEPDSLDSETELSQAVTVLSDLAKIAPTLLLCTSNHIDRRAKAALRSNLARSELVEWSKVLGAPKSWRWADEWVINNVCYFHGTELSGRSPGKQAITKKRMSVVFGHLHTKAEIIWHADGKWRNFSAASGCLIDSAHPAFRYTKSIPQLGATVVYDGYPIFVPLKA